MKQAILPLPFCSVSERVVLMLWVNDSSTGKVVSYNIL